MQFNLDKYDLGERIFSLAKCELTLNKLRENNLNTAFLDGNSLILYPEQKKYYLNDSSLDTFNNCEDYDVLYISETGYGYICYNNKSNDNLILITQRCNSNCIMCPTGDHIRRCGESMSAEMILESIKYIPSDAPHITITGGEPFLIKEKIFPIFSELKSRLSNTEFLLLTNGRALGYKPYAKKFFDTAPPNIIVGIPIHGHTSETHDYITQSKGGFIQTITGIKNLLYYGFNVEIRIVVSKLNYKYISNIADLIVNELRSCDSVKIMGLEMSGNAAINRDFVWIPYQTAFEYSKEAINKLVMHNIDVSLYNFPLCAVDKRYHMLCAKSISENKIRYTESCNDCVKRDSCGGIFAGTYKLACDDVVPWINA